MPLQFKFDCKWEIDKPAGKPHSSDHYNIIWYKKYSSIHRNISGIVLFIGIFTVLYVYIEFVIF